MTKLLTIKVLCLAMLFSMTTMISVGAQATSDAAATIFSGRVVDRFGVGIDNASVLVKRENQSWKLRSDERGRFSVPLQDGIYELSVDRAGFNKVCDVKFMIAGGIPSRRDFPMDVAIVIDTVFIQPSAAPTATSGEPAPQPNIGVNGYYSNDKAQRGRSTRAAIVMEIPSGYHVNSNRPLNKYSIPTSVKIDAPRGVNVSAVIYPRAIVRKLKASNNEPLAVFEGRAILRFNVTLPANYQGGDLVLKAHVRYQSCNDEVCFPPKNQDVDLGIGVVGANDRVQRANGWVFGRR